VLRLLPRAVRRRMARRARAGSESAKVDKPAAIMDVNADTVQRVLQIEHAHRLIHGHTHRPARHVHLVDGRYCERWVLADWHSEAHWLAWDGTAIEAHRLHPAGC
jgi:UDP-2,3-diacylglucosamine hydrolase